MPDLRGYVRLSFNASHPMMHMALRDQRVRKVEILKIDPTVIYLEPTLFSDGNANDVNACVGGDLESFKRIRFDIATSPNWVKEWQKR